MTEPVSQLCIVLTCYCSLKSETLICPFASFFCFFCVAQNLKEECVKLRTRVFDLEQQNRILSVLFQQRVKMSTNPITQVGAQTATGLLLGCFISSVQKRKEKLNSSCSGNQLHLWKFHNSGVLFYIFHNCYSSQSGTLERTMGHHTSITVPYCSLVSC